MVIVDKFLYGSTMPWTEESTCEILAPNYSLPGPICSSCLPHNLLCRFAAGDLFAGARRDTTSQTCFHTDSGEARIKMKGGLKD